MECRDVGVSNEGFRIAAEDFRIQVREESHRSIPSGAADHRFHIGVEPDSHQVLGAPLVLFALEPPKALNLGVKNHVVPCAFVDHQLDFNHRAQKLVNKQGKIGGRPGTACVGHFGVGFVLHGKRKQGNVGQL